MIQFLVWAFRVVIGGIFLFSGFVKGVDPFGTLYKFREYLAALDIWLPDTVLLTGVIGLCIFEFLLGLTLITGSFRRSTPIMSFCLMIVMTVITLWTAVADPVGDCGCFGDALVLSNWATFVKNLLILAGLVFLLRYNRQVPCLVTPYLQWILVPAGGIFILILSLYGYNLQPPIDFRPYKVGKAMEIEEGSDTENNGSEDDNLIFVYRRGNEIREVTVSDELPDEDEGWEFVERREIDKGSEEKKSGFKSGADMPIQFNPEAVRDLADDDISELGVDSVAKPERDKVLILIPELDRLSKTQAWKIEEIVREAGSEGIDRMVVVSGSDASMKIWEDVLGGIDFYKEEDTLLKMMARGNPAVIMLKNGRIAWKSTLKSLPINDGEGWLGNYSRDDGKVLLALLSGLGACVFALILASRLPYLFSLMRRSSIRM